MVVDLADRPRFYIEGALSLGINRAIGLVIGGAVSTRTDIAIGFSGLSL